MKNKKIPNDISTRLTNISTVATTEAVKTSFIQTTLFKIILAVMAIVVVGAIIGAIIPTVLLRSSTTLIISSSATTYSFTVSINSTTINSTFIRTTPTTSSTLVSTLSTAPTTSSTLVSTVSTTITSSLGPTVLCPSATWNPNAITIAGNGSSGRLGRQISYPIDAAVDSQGNLIISEWGNNRVRKFFTNGTIVILLADIRVWKLFIDRFDNIYCLTFEDYLLQLTPTNSLSIIGGDGYPGSFLNEFHQALDLYVDQSGTIYVADTGNDRIMKWSVGATQGIVVANGSGLYSPNCIFVDEINEIGALYICDYYNNRILKYLPGSVNGTTVIGGYNNQNQWRIIQPHALVLDPTTQIMFILDSHSRIWKWLPNATEGIFIAGGVSSLSTNGPNQLDSVRSIKFDAQWNLYVADYNNHRVQKFMFNRSSCANYIPPTINPSTPTMTITNRAANFKS